MDDRVGPLQREREGRAVTAGAAHCDGLFGEADPFGQVDEVRALCGGEREQPGPVAGRVADALEGPVDHPDPFVVGDTDDAVVPTVVGEHSPYEEVDVIV